MRRFRNRLRGLRDRWRAGTIGMEDVDARVAPGSPTPSMPTPGACATRSSGAAGSIRPRPLEAWTAPCRRVVRGGSWNNNPDNLRSANRNRNNTDNRNNNLGFRVAARFHAGAGAITVAPGAHQASRAIHDEHGRAQGRPARPAPVLGDAWLRPAPPALRTLPTSRSLKGRCATAEGTTPSAFRDWSKPGRVRCRPCSPRSPIGSFLTPPQLLRPRLRPAPPPRHRASVAAGDRGAARPLRRGGGDLAPDREEALDVARANPDQPLLRGLDPHANVFRACRQAARGGRHEHGGPGLSSVKNGDTLIDAAMTLNATRPDIRVVRRHAALV